MITIESWGANADGYSEKTCDDLNQIIAELTEGVDNPLFIKEVEDTVWEAYCDGRRAALEE